MLGASSRALHANFTLNQIGHVLLPIQISAFGQLQRVAGIWPPEQPELVRRQLRVFPRPG